MAKGIELGAAHVPIRADLDALKKDLDTAQSKIRDTLGSAMRTAAASIAVGAAAAGAAIGAIGVTSIQAASDVNESLSKVGVVFGENAKDIEAWASKAATSMGLSRGEALAASGTLGNLFGAMGMTSEASAGLSKEMVQMASDFASFNNIPVADALDKIRAGLVGEAEPLRALGVNLNAASVQAEALRMGLVQGAVDSVKVQAAQVALTESQVKYNAVMRNGAATTLEKEKAAAALATAEAKLNELLAGSIPELDAQQKAMATASLIMQQGSAAQGDFARTSDGMANATKIIQATFADLHVQIGNQLLPVIAPLISSFAQALPGAIEAARPHLEALGTVIQQAAVTAGELVTAFQRDVLPALGAVASFVQENIGPILAGLGAALVTTAGIFVALSSAAITAAAATALAMAPVVLAVAAVGAAAFLLKRAWDENLGDIQGKTAAVWQGMQPIFNQLEMSILLFVEDVLPDLQKTWAVVVEGIQKATAAFGVFWNEHWGTISKVLDATVTALTVVIDTAFSGLTAIIQTALALIRGDWQGAWDGVLKYYRVVWYGIKGVVDAVLPLIQEALSQAWEGMRNNFVQDWTTFTGRVETAFNDLKGRFERAGSGFMDLLRQGITSRVDGVMAPIRKMVADVAALLPHSYADEGPLSEPVSWHDVLWGDLRTEMPALITEFETSTGDIATHFSGMRKSMQADRKLISEELADLSTSLDTTAKNATVSASQLRQAMQSFHGATAQVRNHLTPTDAMGGVANAGATPLVRDYLTPGEAMAGDKPKYQIPTGFDWASYNYDQNVHAAHLAHSVGAAANAASAGGSAGATPIVLEIDGQTIARTLAPYTIPENDHFRGTRVPL